METLNSAARAAGYAMATSDELLNNSNAEARTENEAWRPGETIMRSQVSPPSGNTLHALTDWVKGRVLSVFGRGAPA